MLAKYCPIPKFDEQEYLEKNPDIRQALEETDLSAWEHYVTHGYYRGREGAPKRLDKKIIDLLEDPLNRPSPPEHLKLRVHGARVDEYHMMGRLVALNLLAGIREAKIRVRRRARILDFGCGCGRVASRMRYLFPAAHFFGTDIDHETIGWCQANLSAVADFSANPPMPPLPYPDEHFDLVYSVSVFTHLPEEMQFAWLEELRRITKPGGWLLLTVHGKELFPLGRGKANVKFAEDGFFYAADKGTDGLPDFYQTTFHTEHYIMDHWSQFFDIQSILKKTVGGRQDLVVCHRPSRWQLLWRRIIGQETEHH